MSSEVEDKLVDMEIRFAHQQDHVEQLDRIIYRQQQSIDALAERLGQLEKRLKSATETNILQPEEESPPPHY
jgi:SlyX protein